MKNSVEIPVADELKEKYISTLDLLDFTVSRAFDPNRQYKIMSVPRTMTFETFSRVVAQDFSMGEFEHMLLDQLGNQIVKCSTVEELYERYGD